MSQVFIECTYDEDCTFVTRNLHPKIALMNLDDHLQDEHDTDFETEVERLEEEEGKDFEELIQEQVEEQQPE